jgi:hypothetical protein
MQVRSLSAAVLGLALLATPAAAEVRLIINGGRVSLWATNATVSQILAEWAKVGQTTIVNGERIPGGPVTLELTDVPEVDAIEIVLRSAGGYLLAPRSTNSANTSRFDRILVLPTSSPQRPSVSAQPAPAPVLRQPQFNQPAAAPDENDDPAERPNPPNAAAPNTRPPVFNTFPQPPPRTSPPPVSAPTSSPSAPPGVSVPGMVVPTPAPQGQPGAPPPQ